MPDALVVHQLLGLPAPVALAATCGLLLVETVAQPGVLLPGGTAVLLAGALAGGGGVRLWVSVPLLIAVLVAGDHAAYALGRRVRRWVARRSAAAGDHDPPARGRWASVALAAYPSVAGAARLPYRAFLPRLLVLRALWLPLFLVVGEVGGRSLGSVQRLGGVGAVGVLGVLLVGRRRAGRPGLVSSRGLAAAALVVLAVAGAWVCAGVLQDVVAHEEVAAVNPQVAGFLVNHVPAGAGHAAVVGARLVQPPGLWVMTAMVVMLLDCARRGRSTVRFAVVAAGALAGAAVLNAAFAGAAGSAPASVGAAGLAGLGLSVALFCRRGPAGVRLSWSAADAVLAAGFVAALLVAGTPTTAVVIGGAWGLAWAALAELVALLPWLPGHRLLDGAPAAAAAR